MCLEQNSLTEPKALQAGLNSELTKDIGPSLPAICPQPGEGGEEVDSYRPHRCLRVSECNQLEWNSNSAL